MKQLFALFLASCLVLAGCGATPAHTVQTRVSADGEWIEKNITNPTNGVETEAQKYSINFIMTPEALVAEVDKRAAEKGYPNLTEKIDEGRVIYRGAALIAADLTDDGITEIRLSLYSDDEERAKANGDYLYILIDIFNPGMQELISDELLVFEESTADSPGLVSLTCGNTLYSFLDSKLCINPLAPPYVEPPQPPKPPSAIRPES